MTTLKRARKFAKSSRMTDLRLRALSSANLTSSRLWALSKSTSTSWQRKRLCEATIKRIYLVYELIYEMVIVNKSV